MTRKTRAILVLLGLLIVIFALTALAYALLPGETLREQAPIAPTLFTLPPGGAP